MKKFFVALFSFVMLFSISVSANLPTDVNGNVPEVYHSTHKTYQIMAVCDRGHMHVFFLDDDNYDPSKSYKAVCGDNGVAQYVLVDDISESVDTSFDTSSSEVTSPVLSLDAAIDDLCQKYSISEYELYFHLLKSILSETE